MLRNFAVRQPRLARRFVITLALTIGGGVANAQNQIVDPRLLAPYVPTPESVVEQMLDAAGVTKDDVVYDLGSGDGRILIAAAEEFHAKAVGIEINPTLVAQTRKKVEELGLSDLVTVQQAHLMDADLSPATVVMVYLLSSSNEQLKPKFEKSLPPRPRGLARLPVPRLEAFQDHRRHRRVAPTPHLRLRDGQAPCPVAAPEPYNDAAMRRFLLTFLLAASLLPSAEIREREAFANRPAIVVANDKIEPHRAAAL
ncbi:MAG: class I SAM-dependent methyltransferase [Bryobacterales bacterium]